MQAEGIAKRTGGKHALEPIALWLVRLAQNVVDALVAFAEACAD
jgi:hypothetical protein